MEHVNEVAQIISTIGFPIACSCSMLWLLWQTNQEHKSEINTLKDAINANTLVLTKLADRIDNTQK